MLDLGRWKLYKTIFQSVLEAKKLVKQKYSSNWLKPHYSHFKYGALIRFLSIILQILFLECRYYHLWILQRLGCLKMYRNTFQDVLEAEKGVKQKWILFFKHPVFSVQCMIKCKYASTFASMQVCHWILTFTFSKIPIKCFF